MVKNFLEKYSWIIFAGVALLLVYPSIAPGYIFALDWAIKPFISWSDLTWSDPLGWIICDLFSIIFTFVVFQRILLFAMIILAGVAGFRLVKNTDNIYAQYFAGFLLIFNPFFYARVLEQPTLLGAGMVSFFWFWVMLMEALKEESMKKMVYAALCAALTVSFFAHSIFFVGIVFVSMCIAHYSAIKDWRKCAVVFLLFWMIVLMLNSNWIIASFIHGDTWASKVENFTYDDIEAFRTRKIGGYSVYATVLALQGYWGEYQDRFISIQDNFLWIIGFLGIGSIALYGIISTWQKKIFAKTFVVLFAIAFILAIGIASPLIKPYALLLYEYVPFYMGLREPQKWVMIMVVVYAYAGAWGIASLYKSKRVRSYRSECALVCALLPIVFSFAMIKGVHEYIVPRDFPKSWYEAREYMQKNYDGGKTLFLPWHAYMHVDFAQKNIMNPAKRFFGSHVISGNNVEFGNVQSNFSDPQTRTIEKYVENGEKLASQFKRDIDTIDVRKIIVAKTEDWHTYIWIEEVNGIKKVMETNEMIIYSVEHDTEKSKNNVKKPLK